MRALAAILGAALVVVLAAPPTGGSSAAVDPAAVDPATARERIVAAVERDLASDPGVPGEIVAVRAPGIDVTVASGLADRTTATPLAPETPFRIASVTKTFVAAAVLKLVGRGRLDLDDPIADHLSRRAVRTLRRGGYDPDAITVRQLLRHTAGLFDYATTDAYDWRNERDPGHHWTRDEQLRFAMHHGERVGEPGERYHYSDTGYILLGEIVERVTGENLGAAVRRLVGFERLGLDHTSWEQLEPAPGGLPPRAHQYAGDFDNATLDASHDLYGGGGLVSTVGDLTRFYRALFHGRVIHDRAVLREMTKVPKPSRRAGAGMGIFRVDVDGETCFEHPGYWGTDALHCPRLDLTLVRTINQADDSDFDYGPLEAVAADLARGHRLTCK
jgi:D-alanyl-D-alanine carboxypeptidase